MTENSQTHQERKRLADISQTDFEQHSTPCTICAIKGVADGTDPLRIMIDRPLNLLT